MAPRGLIGGAPLVKAEVEVERKYRREPGFPVSTLITPATLWLVVSGDMAKLTKRMVDAAAAGASAAILWDYEVKGFGLRVSPGGSKSYILNYRAGRGRNAPQRRITIGKHGSPWTPDMARREALRLLGAIAAGVDPAAARKAEARTMTLSTLCELYLAEGTGHKKPTTLKADRGRIKNHIMPLLGKLRIDRITPADVERMVREVTAGRTAAPVPQQPHRGKLVQGGSGTAAQALAVLGAVMSFAVARGLRDDNPVRGVKKPQVRHRERFLSEAEITRLGEALDAEAKTTGDPYPAAAIRLLLPPFGNPRSALGVDRLRAGDDFSAGQ
jgi:hypothetical protein